MRVVFTTTTNHFLLLDICKLKWRLFHSHVTRFSRSRGGIMGEQITEQHRWYRIASVYVLYRARGSDDNQRIFRADAIYTYIYTFYLFSASEGGGKRIYYVISIRWVEIWTHWIGWLGACVLFVWWGPYKRCECADVEELCLSGLSPRYVVWIGSWMGLLADCQNKCAGCRSISNWLLNALCFFMLYYDE